ncbi:hypothetical protein [Nocardia cyriacigeorgica]|uniref:hypothetical protein n=1 Tax=Nocardia cyriacigeorgica TaxID=135487 RepID=UPI00245599D1|nr:hypothetical protein [Nocardia cyriacigeorgica]
MNSRIIRPLAVAGLVLTAAAIGAAPATADTAAPVAGTVEVCAPIHLRPLEQSFCL